MCGIVASVSNKDVVNNLISGLHKLEYRGYDSSGIATLNNNKISLIKASGKLGVSMALQSRSGVIGLDDDKGSELGLIDFKRIKGGKPFDAECDWFQTLLESIGQLPRKA